MGSVASMKSQTQCLAGYCWQVFALRFTLSLSLICIHLFLEEMRELAIVILTCGLKLKGKIRLESTLLSLYCHCHYYWSTAEKSTTLHVLKMTETVHSNSVFVSLVYKGLASTLMWRTEMNSLISRAHTEPLAVIPRASNNSLPCSIIQTQ